MAGIYVCVCVCNYTTVRMLLESDMLSSSSSSVIITPSNSFHTVCSSEGALVVTYLDVAFPLSLSLSVSA